MRNSKTLKTSLKLNIKEEKLQHQTLHFFKYSLSFFLWKLCNSCRSFTPL